MKSKSYGFDYFITLEKIKEYRKMPLEKRLTWLFEANLLRMYYPKRIIELQNKFRQGNI